MDNKEKTTRLDVKMTQEEKNLIKSKAAAMGFKLHDYIMYLVYEDAKRQGIDTDNINQK